MIPVKDGERFTVQVKRAADLVSGDILLQDGVLWPVKQVSRESIPAVTYNAITGDASEVEIDFVSIISPGQEPGFVLPTVHILVLILGEGESVVDIPPDWS